ncbi:reverse transcriptase domain-containing protein [Tanacetum coccineum]
MGCSAVILKKFPEKLGGPQAVFLTVCFSEMNECLRPWPRRSRGKHQKSLCLSPFERTKTLCIDSRSPSFTPFGGSDFLMEEIDKFLEHDDSIPPGVDGIYDSEGDTVYLEELLSSPGKGRFFGTPKKGRHNRGTFQRCMVAIFHDMIEKTMEVFMDDFSVFGDSFSSCLSHLDKMLQRCEDTNLVLNWEKCHFMVKEGIVLGHKISKSGIEVDKSKVDVIAKLPHPTTVKGVVFRGSTLLDILEAFATVDPLGDTTVPITPLKRSSIQVVGENVPPSMYRPEATIFALGPFENSFLPKHTYWVSSTCTNCLWMIRGGEDDEWTPYFKHDLCKLVIAKMGSAITYDAEGHELAKR